MKKKVMISAIVLIVFILMLVGYWGLQVVLHPMHQIYTDTRQLASKENVYNLYVQEQSIEDTTYEAKLELEGMGIIWKYNAMSDEAMDVRYLLKAMQGKVKLILVKGNGQIQTIAEEKGKTNSETTQVIRITMAKGENFIKVVAGDYAKIEVKLEVPKGDFRKLGV